MGFNKTTSLFLFFVTISLLYAEVSFGQSEHLIPFRLEDQFQREHSHSDFIGKTIILIGSDKGGSKYNDKWAMAIKKAMKDQQIDIELASLPVADVSSAPFFLHGYVRNQFPKERVKWVLLDWEGEFASAYDFKEDMSNIVVFDKTGKRIYQTSGKEVVDVEVNRIVDSVRKSSL